MTQIIPRYQKPNSLMSWGLLLPGKRIMFSQEVLRCIAAGVGTEVSTLLEGIDLQAKGDVAAHLCTQRLRDAIIPRQKDIQPEGSVWNHCYCLAEKMVTERIAQALICSATKALPSKVEWFDTKSSSVKEISLGELSSKWQNGNIFVKKEIGMALASTLHPRTHADGSKVDHSDGHDSYDQPSERVLPELYGQWQISLAADNRPNCLGKFQLLIAFGNLFGAQMLALTPLRYAGSTASEYRAKACRIIYDTLQELPIQVSEKRQASLFKVFKQRWVNDSLPPLQHFSIAYRVDDSNWLLVDPNSGLSSMMPNSNEMNEARVQLEQHQQTAPGASLLFCNTDEEKRYQQNLALTKSSCKLVTQIAPQLAESKDWQALMQLLTDSGIAPTMLSWDDFMDITGSNRFEKIALRLYNQAYKKKEEPEFTSLAEVDFEKLRETMVYRYLTFGESEILNHYRCQKEYGMVSHPLYEISLAEFRMATATISHVALNISPEVGRATEEILYAFGIAEGHLYNVALGCKSFQSETTQHAMQLLKLQAHRGKLASRLVFSGDESSVS